MHAAGVQVRVGVTIRDLIDVAQVLLAARIRDRLELHDLADARGPPPPQAVDDPPDDGRQQGDPQDPHPVRIDHRILQVFLRVTGHVIPFQEHA